MADTGYSTTAPTSEVGTGGVSDAHTKGKPEYWTLSKCKRAYLDYLGNKTDEIEEQKDARRYYHGTQWTDKQIQALNKRKQPVVTFNRIQRKVDSVVGLLERMRQDPKAYPRTPHQEDGAELATSVLRYVLEQQDSKAKFPEIARDGCIDGIAGVELELEEGDKGDKEVGFSIVEPDSFFYDPQSYREDFSDARYMGVGKWVDYDTAQDMAGGKLVTGSPTDASDLTTNPDREKKWFSLDGNRKMVRLVDIWYKHKNKWCYALFTGSQIIDEGISPFYDEKGKTICRLIMYSAAVDQDGDRYGFVRNMKSPQDEYNSRRSKALHILQSRRLLLQKGSVEDVETARREWARPDGVVETIGPVNESARADDQSFDFAGQLKLLENAVQELENFGPNQALVGQGGVENSSGRAIQLLQQAGIAELGPFILSYRGWKIRLYRALFNAAQRNWSAERYIRVTDDQDLAQWIQINGVGIDPQTGQPKVINALGSLDVDIILDEGPDAINAQADLYETLQQILPSVAPMLKPAQAQAAVSILLESSSISSSAKKQFRDASKEQQDPAAEKAKEIAMAGEAAKVDETVSKTELNKAKAYELAQPQQGAAQKPEKYTPPPHVQDAQAIADIDKTYADADHKRAQAAHISTQAQLAPVNAMLDSEHKNADRQQRDEHYQPASAE